MNRGQYLRITGSAELAGLLIVAVAAAFVWFVASSPSTAEVPPRARLAEHDNRFLLSIYTDPESGCQYLGHPSSNAGITARIAADGKTHMGCKKGDDGKG